MEDIKEQLEAIRAKRNALAEYTSSSCNRKHRLNVPLHAARAAHSEAHKRNVQLQNDVNALMQRLDDPKTRAERQLEDEHISHMRDEFVQYARSVEAICLERSHSGKNTAAPASASEYDTGQDTIIPPMAQTQQKYGNATTMNHSDTHTAIPADDTLQASSAVAPHSDDADYRAPSSLYGNQSAGETGRNSPDPSATASSLTHGSDVPERKITEESTAFGTTQKGQRAEHTFHKITARSERRDSAQDQQERTKPAEAKDTFMGRDIKAANGNLLHVAEDSANGNVKRLHRLDAQTQHYDMMSQPMSRDASSASTDVYTFTEHEGAHSHTQSFAGTSEREEDPVCVSMLQEENNNNTHNAQEDMDACMLQKDDEAAEPTSVLMETQEKRSDETLPSTSRFTHENHLDELSTGTRDSDEQQQYTAPVPIAHSTGVNKSMNAMSDIQEISEEEEEEEEDDDDAPEENHSGIKNNTVDTSCYTEPYEHDNRVHPMENKENQKGSEEVCMEETNSNNRQIDLCNKRQEQHNVSEAQEAGGTQPHHEGSPAAESCRIGISEGDYEEEEDELDAELEHATEADPRSQLQQGTQADKTPQAPLFDPRRRAASSTTSRMRPLQDTESEQNVEQGNGDSKQNTQHQQRLKKPNLSFFLRQDGNDVSSTSRGSNAAPGVNSLPSHARKQTQRSDIAQQLKQSGLLAQSEHHDAHIADTDADMELEQEFQQHTLRGRRTS